MGDLNAVEIGQAAHVALAVRAGAIRPGEELRPAFEAIDADKSGLLSREEVRRTAPSNLRYCVPHLPFCSTDDAWQVLAAMEAVVQNMPNTDAQAAGRDWADEVAVDVG